MPLVPGWPPPLVDMPLRARRRQGQGDSAIAPPIIVTVNPAPGVGKIISFDPPGAIGLVDDTATVLLRLNETTTAAMPADSAGSLNDLGISSLGLMAGINMPTVVPGVIGNARHFDPAFTSLLFGSDRVAGASLLTRDMTIQLILRWDAAGQVASGARASVVTRGFGFSYSAAETTSYQLIIDPAGLPSGQGRIRWRWERLSGAQFIDTNGGVFTAPLGFTLLTATRRWISPTSSLLRYYIADQLIAENAVADGDIGGSTTGNFQVGSARVGAGFGQTFVGDIDELMVLDHEITREEIEATWLRITRYQPLGVQLFVELHDDGFPLPADPASDVQLENRLIGNALGFAAAQAENVRANALPQRAYGEVLEQWEETVRVTPQQPQDIDTRRARVLAKIRQRRGSSIPGLDDALVGLLGGAPVEDLEFLAYDNTVIEPFATIDPLRWDVTPAASWIAVSGGARSSPAAGDYTFNGTWRYAQMSISGDGRETQLISKVLMTTPQSKLECGIFFANRGTNDFLLLGLRDTAGVFSIVTESFIAGVSQTAVTQTTLGGNPAALWLWLFQTPSNGTWQAAWSTTSGTAGFTTSANITHPTLAHWGGLYVRSIGGATAGAGQVDADDLIMRTPYGHRTSNAYVLLDSALGFSPDVEGAHSVIRIIRHAFVNGTFITDANLKCSAPFGCGRGPMGGEL